MIGKSDFFFSRIGFAVLYNTFFFGKIEVISNYFIDHAGALKEMCKMIIAMSWRVKVKFSVCVHFKSYCLEVDAVILSKYIFTNHTCLYLHMGTASRDTKGTSGRLPFLSAWAANLLVFAYLIRGKRSL